MNAAAPLTLEERRRRLALICELDRLHLRLALRPAARGSGAAIGGVPLSVLNKAFSFAQFLPGKIGRWARGAALGADLINLLNPFSR
ncbi:MAG: hypothetical protein JNK23_06390 [Opitutaceae bacterium]|nr:hypothetical protein [Opitutaceae bacterium]